MLLGACIDVAGGPCCGVDGPASEADPSLCPPICRFARLSDTNILTDKGFLGDKKYAQAPAEAAVCAPAAEF